MTASPLEDAPNNSFAERQTFYIANAIYIITTDNKYPTFNYMEQIFILIHLLPAILFQETVLSSWH